MEATVKHITFDVISRGDTGFVIKVRGALFDKDDTESGESQLVRLQAPKYYICKSIDQDGVVLDWSEFIYVMDEEHLDFKQITYNT